jgi:hypothetical protein
MAAFPNLEPEVRARLEARGLDPEVVYAELIEDVLTVKGYLPRSRQPNRRPRTPVRLPLAMVLEPGQPNPFPDTWVESYRP